MERIEFNKIAKKIQSRLSRKGIAVSLEDIRNHMETMDELNQESEMEIEQYWVDACSKPVLTNESSDITTVKKTTENMVATAATELQISLTKEQIAEIANDFSHGYTKVISDVSVVLELLKKWIIHQETTTANEIERLHGELSQAISGSHNRTAKRVKGLLESTKKTQADFLSIHNQEIDEIHDFFSGLMGVAP